LSHRSPSTSIPIALAEADHRTCADAIFYVLRTGCQ
jgi:transposase